MHICMYVCVCVCVCVCISVDTYMLRDSVKHSLDCQPELQLQSTPVSAQRPQYINPGVSPLLSERRAVQSPVA